MSALSFSIDGKWLTDFIREKFFYGGEAFDWVINTIRDLFKDANCIDDERVEQMAQDIILGRSYFRGQTGDGSFIYCDGSDEPIRSDFFRKYSALQEKLRKEESARKDAVEAWQELALVVAGELSKNDCYCKCNIELFRPTPTEEYIERMISADEDVAPYGFVDPYGNFHTVDWSNHEAFAGDYVRGHFGGFTIVVDSGYDTAKDFLVLEKGWLLLHNPQRGKPILTSGEKPMTKAQREFLFDYYTKYGMKNEANALYEGVEKR